MTRRGRMHLSWSQQQDPSRWHRSSQWTNPQHWCQRSQRWEPSSLVWHCAKPISRMDMELAHCSSIRRNSRTCWWHFRSIPSHSISSSNWYHVRSSIHGIFDDSSRTHIRRMEFSLLVHATRGAAHSHGFSHWLWLCHSQTCRLSKSSSTSHRERALKTSKSSSRQYSSRRPSSTTIVSQFQLRRWQCSCRLGRLHPPSASTKCSQCLCYIWFPRWRLMAPTFQWW